MGCWLAPISSVNHPGYIPADSNLVNPRNLPQFESIGVERKMVVAQAVVSRIAIAEL